MIELFDDFRDLLVELHKSGARFVVLGGHAVAFHGHPRATKDLDVLVEVDGCAIPVIGRGALIKNKRAAGRPQDMADVKALDSE